MPGVTTSQPLFQSVDSKLFFSRNDLNDPRLGDLAKALPPATSAQDFTDSVLEIIQTHAPEFRHYVIAGYPDDEGIRINGGRPGASLAPTEVRRPLYKMTPSLIKSNAPLVWDAGDLKPSAFDLQKRHQVISDCAQATLSAGGNWIGIGGGHDYGFADAAAFCSWCKTKGIRPLVINFDAHLDVRPTSGGLSSGTPFFRMLEAFPETDFVELGIQAHCNSRAHLEWVKSKGARVLTQEQFEISGQPLATLALDLMGDWILKSRPVFLSIDIDGFSSSVAPGCSQSWATGFMPMDFFPLLEVLTARLDVKLLGIYEVSPPLDQDARTAKLAAQIIHRVLWQ